LRRSKRNKKSGKNPNFDLLQAKGEIATPNMVLKAYQTSVRAIGDRSTFFYEIVQRVNNYDGFGLDNIEALFKAMELELNLKLN
jgi:4-hydroxyphenylpyruvate dioxygenase-like putative hemolysin